MINNIPLADLQAQYRSIKPEIDSAIQSVLDSSQYILGKAVADFETDFARAHGVKHCVAVGSGTDALHVALWAEGIGPGDEVITVPFTFIATVEAISLLGARPIFVDIDARTYTLDPKQLKAKINRNTKVILPVHLYGQAANMVEICDIASKNGITVVEDAAQAHLAKFDGKFVGQFGRSACFSFYPGKNLGAYGEAGAVITDDDALARKMRQIRDHGQSEKYKHEFWGHNYRMDGIQGAVLGVKLRYLHSWTERRREIASRYRNALQGVGDLGLPFEDSRSYHVYHLFVISTQQRDELQIHLANQGISSGLHYPIPLHLQPAYSNIGYGPGDFPFSETAGKNCLTLPLFAEMTPDQVESVIAGVRDFYQ